MISGHKRYRTTLKGGFLRRTEFIGGTGASRLSHVTREDGEYASQVKTPEPTAPVEANKRSPSPAWMPAYEALRQDWNSEDYPSPRATMIPSIRELTENPDIPAKSRAPLIQVRITSAISRPANISWTIQAKLKDRWMRAPLSRTLRWIRNSS